jgi:pre-rRNA-processing protein TSR1
MGEIRHSHRPSSLHQSNKPFKSRHASKGQLKEKHKGKVNRISQNPKKKLAFLPTKASRRHVAKMTQLQRHKEIMKAKKKVGHLNGAPKIVVLVGLSEEVDVIAMMHRLYQANNTLHGREPNEYTMEHASSFGSSVYIEDFKQKYILIASKRDIMNVLDLARVADFLLVVFSAEHPLDAFGNLVITCIKAQGLPSSVGLLEVIILFLMHLYRFHICYCWTKFPIET